MLACIECQVEQCGYATLRDTYSNGCVDTSTASNLSAVLEARGVIDKAPREPDWGHIGRYPTELSFVNKVPLQLSELLREFRPCGRDQAITPPPKTKFPS